MALNLVRNSKVYFTTNLDTQANGYQVLTTGHTNATTFEIQVLEGFTFSQNTNTETVTLNEAGSAPSRGQRTFNTSLAPVDFTFTTYMRPYNSSGVKAEESVLWDAMFAAQGTNAWSAGTISLANSNANQLKRFGLVIIVDNVTYLINNCVLTQATVDFGLDGIASIQWTGQAASVKQADNTFGGGSGNNFGNSAGSYLAKTTTAGFIANKLSTLSLVKGGTTYNIPITGGSLTINNNVTYLTPANLGIVNAPITYFTGTRSITGTINAYLRTGGSTDTGTLLKTMLANAATDIEPEAAITLAVGGSTATTKVTFSMPTAVVTIPTIDVQQVVSTAINFTAQGKTGGVFDLDATNELTITYSA